MLPTTIDSELPGILATVALAEVHGQERTECPFPCLYHGEGLPVEGMKPAKFWQRDESEEPCEAEESA